MREPIPTIINPMIAFGEAVSPIKATANNGIQINIVLLIILDSTADKVLPVWFHKVKAKAVFTISSQRMIPHPLISITGIPSMDKPTPSSNPNPLKSGTHEFYLSLTKYVLLRTPGH